MLSRSSSTMERERRSGPAGAGDGKYRWWSIVDAANIIPKREYNPARAGESLELVIT
jgi:hypothetical protein